MCAQQHATATHLWVCMAGGLGSGILVGVMVGADAMSRVPRLTGYSIAAHTGISLHHC